MRRRLNVFSRKTYNNSAQYIHKCTLRYIVYGLLMFSRLAILVSPWIKSAENKKTQKTLNQEFEELKPILKR